MRFRFALAFVLIPAMLSAQSAPLVGTTVKSTSPSVASLCVGCPLGSTTPVANSSAKVATLTIQQLAAPIVTTDKLYNVSGLLSWLGGFAPTYTQYPTSIAPVANGTVSRIANTGLTSIGVAGVVYDWSVYIPSGASPVIGNPTGTQNILYGGSTGFGTNLSDLNTTPTISGGAGTSSTIVGKAFAFRVNVGLSPTNTITVAFNGTYANEPVCVVTSTDLTHPSYVTTTTTTINILSGTTAWVDAAILTILCRGY